MEVAFQAGQNSAFYWRVHCINSPKSALDEATSHLDIENERKGKSRCLLDYD